MKSRIFASRSLEETPQTSVVGVGTPSGKGGQPPRIDAHLAALQQELKAKPEYLSASNEELAAVNAELQIKVGASKGTPVDGLAGHLRKPYRAAEFQRALRRVFAPEDTLLQSESMLNAEARPGVEPLRNEGSGHSQ